MRVIITILIVLPLLLTLQYCSDPTETQTNQGAGSIVETMVVDSLQLSGQLDTTYISARVEDPDGLSDVRGVYFYSRNPDGSLGNNGSAYEMYDGGSLGDETAGDGIYTRRVIFSGTAPLGVYEFSFFLIDKAGNVSPRVSDSLKLYKTSVEPNKGPGTILETHMPDSMQIPITSETALIEALVEDPDGLDDVASVYFYSRKPDGSLANGGEPFYMVDDGTQGDITAGDGTYSMTIMITNSAQAGTYIFTFYMRDRSGNLSESKTDSIKVYQ